MPRRLPVWPTAGCLGVPGGHERRRGFWWPQASTNRCIGFIIPSKDPSLLDIFVLLHIQTMSRRTTWWRREPSQHIAALALRGHRLALDEEIYPFLLTITRWMNQSPPRQVWPAMKPGAWIGV
ncbi:hypothetical protein SORBI_3002G076200 [Sorghum bicolor]|uniref:Uncharacterized protein n=1 Tax=Sorghum bicolor TaxID=4558 RepID=A0A1B6Q9U8_SORBI|nr:hypothetical protein SORBI_3002G076200 [Sorghum bicolor]